MTCGRLTRPTRVRSGGGAAGRWAANPLPAHTPPGRAAATRIANVLFTVRVSSPWDVPTRGPLSRVRGWASAVGMRYRAHSPQNGGPGSTEGAARGQVRLKSERGTPEAEQNLEQGTRKVQRRREERRGFLSFGVQYSLFLV